MGAQFNFEVLAATTDAAAKKEVKALIKQAGWDHGHSGYTGSFAEAQGCLIFRLMSFDGVKDAEEWLETLTKKWGPALIVVTKDGTYCVGAMCSS